jgi:hypothetical protein
MTTLTGTVAILAVGCAPRVGMIETAPVYRGPPHDGEVAVQSVFSDPPLNGPEKPPNLAVIIYGFYAHFDPVAMTPAAWAQVENIDGWKEAAAAQGANSLDMHCRPVYAASGAWLGFQCTGYGYRR